MHGDPGPQCLWLSCWYYVWPCSADRKIQFPVQGLAEALRLRMEVGVLGGLSSAVLERAPDPPDDGGVGHPGGLASGMPTA